MSWNRFICAIKDHDWSDARIDFRPEYDYEWIRCSRCHDWILIAPKDWK